MGAWVDRRRSGPEIATRRTAPESIVRTPLTFLGRVYTRRDITRRDITRRDITRRDITRSYH